MCKEHAIKKIYFIDFDNGTVYWVEQGEETGSNNECSDCKMRFMFTPLLTNNTFSEDEGGEVEVWGETTEQEIRTRGIFEMLKKL